MLSEIGSNFWINPGDEQKCGKISIDEFCPKYKDFALFTTCRGAISFVLEHIKSDKKIALLPPFLCHTVLEPFINFGYEVFHYEISENLLTNEKSLLELVKKHSPSVIFLNGYFGFDGLQGIRKHIPLFRENGIFVIEDITQGLFSKYPRANADFFVGSFRKWCGMPDGGFAASREVLFENKPFEKDIALQDAKLCAANAKYEYLFLNIGEKSEFLAKYRKAEDILSSENGYFHISDASQNIFANLDKENLAQRRRENYTFLASRLVEFDFVSVPKPALEDNEVPLYLPLYIKKCRSGLQKHLAKNDIYAPIVWPRPEKLGNIPEIAEKIYSEILCIPIDQRYGIDDMQRVYETFNSFSKEDL